MGAGVFRSDAAIFHRRRVHQFPHRGGRAGADRGGVREGKSWAARGAEDEVRPGESVAAYEECGWVIERNISTQETAEVADCNTGAAFLAGHAIDSREQAVTAFGRRIQPVDATVWLNISAGVWKPRVFLGLSFNCLATARQL